MRNTDSTAGSKTVYNLYEESSSQQETSENLLFYTGQSANDIIKNNTLVSAEDRFVGTTLPDNDWYMSWNGSGS